ncbi:maleylpyruvate isomerase family mycothiol-dependent enzyme [Streptomyces sp. NBC_00825]|uniref:maleylpyruvate isomerase family mycothiol-dependent enzyme n=1 Tax=unclassified Streptomyces TaxID=2593676 RepID=UPI002ED310BD|nr:maleylpyruvate isomerase family mycothiol-dependent enzyme [Streptomyces sp. NBC_00826]WTH88867.1 maleylpyruvate isomerase family mycothiol-dependent enzyme [Streptomyces sp. NBC_00825]WTH97597.1 maleylpyruvate isomerase family mycothiol-dependent enzyme [Streptomyces sp. NBC_00822]
MESATGRDARGTLPEGLGDALRATAEDIATVLRGAADTSVPVPRSEWSVGEAAAHLAQANELMADIAAGRERRYGDGTPQSLAAANERALAEFGERAAGPLAELILRHTDACLTAFERCATDSTGTGDGTGGGTGGEAGGGTGGGTGETAGTVVTPLGPMSREVLGSYLLTHMLGHGYDLARALGRPHMIDRTRVELSLPFLITAMPRVTDATTTARLTASYAIRLWGGARFGVTFTDGAVSVTPRPPARPDCTILIEPVTFLLMALGRIGPNGAMARGRVFARGRKPWLALRFPGLFKAP